MKVLVDECCPRRLKHRLIVPGVECSTVREAGYLGKKNGELITLIDGVFDVLVTIDKNIKYQQNISGRKLSIILVGARSSDLASLIPYVPDILNALCAGHPKCAPEHEIWRIH